MQTKQTACELCFQPGGEVLYRDEKYRIVLIDDANYPGFCRIIWNAHAKEMTDLPAADRALLMETVWRVEQAVREVMQPEKVNLASFGNVVPHLHWHVIPRYEDDLHFPNPVWGVAKRTPSPERLRQRVALLPKLHKAIMKHIEQSIS